MNVSLGKCARWIPANGGNKHNTAMEATKVKGSIVPYTEKPESWSSAGCRKITESESDVINKEMFHFSQLGYFGILFVSVCIFLMQIIMSIVMFQDLSPQPLHPTVTIVFNTITYIGAIHSLLCLVALVLTYIAIK